MFWSSGRVPPAQMRYMRSGMFFCDLLRYRQEMGPGPGPRVCLSLCASLPLSHLQPIDWKGYRNMQVIYLLSIAS